MRYHFENGFPPNFQAPLGAFSLRYTQHAERAAARDRHGDLSGVLPDYLDTRNAKLIEVDIDQNRLASLLYRIAANDRIDICLAIAPGRVYWTVKTVWANTKHDNHQTLRKELYVDSHRELVCV